MKIVHLCLSSSYVDGYAYQENILPKLNKEDGHEVLIIASTEAFINNQSLGYVQPRKYTTEFGVSIIRLPYENVVCDFVTRKIRKYQNLYEYLEQFMPDVIMSHSVTFASIIDVVKFKKNYPKVKFYADTHAATYNSGKNWISLNVLHRIIYKYYIKKAIPYIDRFLYVGEEERMFAIANYSIPPNIMEFYPLGGIVPSNEEYCSLRKKYRMELGLNEKEMLLVHSGKMDPLKKTDMLLKAFRDANCKNLKLVLIGSITNETKFKGFSKSVKNLIDTTKNVLFLGWKTPEELRGYLCACDLYCQPGSVSATMQNAVCCFCPIMSYPHLSYKPYDYGNIIWVNDEDDIRNSFIDVYNNRYKLNELANKSIKCAKELLDYKVLARRLYK